MRCSGKKLHKLCPFAQKKTLTIILRCSRHRVYSTVIGNGRTLQEDTVICGYNVPKGIQVVFPTIVTGSMEQYCQNAGEFKPERWLKSTTGDGAETIHPFASLPYGHGARMCLGRRFADLEMQILLAKVSIHADDRPRE